MIAALALTPIAYLLGTFPSAAMVARSKGVDITAAGSGNPGASNVARVLGTKWGVAVFVLDALKGAIPAGAGLLVGSRPGAYVLAAAAVLGHMYPATRRFRGGKGVATIGGALFVLHTLVSAAMLLGWLVVRRSTGKASLASLAVAVAYPATVAILGSPAWELLAIVGLALIVLLRHTANIRRLFGGNELAASKRAP
ncbi:MAG: glycerol-3-phosphate 1-O-acyltransferase PlsY [Ilumatobacteraceae bacterium]